MSSPEGFAEGGRGGDGLGACTRRFETRLVILGEEGNQFPTHERQLAFAFFVEPHDGEERARRDVIVRGQNNLRVHLFRVEGVGD